MQPAHYFFERPLAVEFLQRISHRHEIEGRGLIVGVACKHDKLVVSFNFRADLVQRVCHKALRPRVVRLVPQKRERMLLRYPEAHQVSFVLLEDPLRLLVQRELVGPVIPGVEGVDLAQERNGRHELKGHSHRRFDADDPTDLALHLLVRSVGVALQLPKQLPLLLGVSEIVQTELLSSLERAAARVAVVRSRCRA